MRTHVFAGRNTFKTEGVASTNFNVTEGMLLSSLKIKSYQSCSCEVILPKYKKRKKYRHHLNH